MTGESEREANARHELEDAASMHGAMRTQNTRDWLRDAIGVYRTAIREACAAEMQQVGEGSELSEAEEAAVKALLDAHHCGAEEGKHCGGCVRDVWRIVHASRAFGAAHAQRPAAAFKSDVLALLEPKP